MSTKNRIYWMLHPCVGLRFYPNGWKFLLKHPCGRIWLCSLQGNISGDKKWVFIREGVNISVRYLEEFSGAKWAQWAEEEVVENIYVEAKRRGKTQFFFSYDDYSELFKSGFAIYSHCPRQIWIEDLLRRNWGVKLREFPRASTRRSPRHTGLECLKMMGTAAALKNLLTNQKP